MKRTVVVASEYGIARDWIAKNGRSARDYVVISDASPRSALRARGIRPVEIVDLGGPHSLATHEALVALSVARRAPHVARHATGCACSGCERARNS